MANDSPQIIDQSTLTGVFNADSFLKIGVEGVGGLDGDATVNKPETITTAEEAVAAFGDTSSLTHLVSRILARGIESVSAVSCDPTHDLDARKAAWAALEDDPTVRIRLTDDATQATLAALCRSCEHAEAINNKQFCFGGIPAPTSKSTLGTVAAAMSSKRGVLVGPGVYDSDGVLRSGANVAAILATEVAKNPDITDSLNLYEIPGTTGLEKEAATGHPLFRLRTNGGSPIDDFADLLDDGVSPLGQAPSGVANIHHLSTSTTRTCSSSVT